MSLRSYRDLRVWQAGMKLAVDVCRFARTLPREEQFGLASQMKRAAVSVPANIAEGHSRQYDREFRQFLRIASGSLAELETYLFLCEELGYMDNSRVVEFLNHTAGIGKMIHRLVATTQERRMDTQEGSQSSTPADSADG